MSTALWVAAAVLAAVFAGVGYQLVQSPRSVLEAKGLTWVEDFTDDQVRAIGTLEVLGAVGLLLPPLLGVMPVLAPVAATGLALVMLGAAVVHVRRGEVLPNVVVTLALALGSAFVAWGRFGPEAF